MEPSGTSFVPRDTAAERAQRVKVALQIRERIVARSIVQAFFAGLPGGADGEDGRLDGLGSVQAIVAADLKKANVALAAVEVPFQGRGHGDDAGGLEDAGFLGEWIGETRGLRVRCTKERVAIFGDVGNGEDFAIAEPDEALAEARFGFIVRKARGSLAGSRKTRRKFVEPVDAGDFLDEIDFALDFRAPGRLRALPGSEQGAFGAAILIDTHGSETEGGEAGFDLLVGNVGAHDAEELGAGEQNCPGHAFAGIGVNNSGEEFASGELQDEPGAAARGELGHFGIGAAAEARGGFGVKFQEARGAANSDGIEPGALDQNVFRGEGDFRFGAAHDAADAHGAGAIAITDHADARGEHALDAVEGANFFTWLGEADDDAVIADFVVVESVEGVAEFEHHVVGGIDDIVDAGDAGGFEAVFEPLRRGLNFRAANHAGGEAAAKLGRLDLDAGSVANFCGGTFLRLRRNGLQRELVNGADFASDAVVAEAVGAIRRNLSVDDRTVRAIFDAADVGARESEARR